MSAQQQLKILQDRIASACERAHRPAQSVQLLAVSKTFPAQAVLDFAQAGQKAFGENYLQEAVEKITYLADSPECPSLQWHFIGPLQSNKTRAVAEHFDWVHSVDRLKIAQRLSQQRPAGLEPLQVLVQVNTSGEDSKSGVQPDEVIDLCAELGQLPSLTFRGLMTIPSNTEDQDALRGEFDLCRHLLTQLQAQGHEHADTLSMGMSSDLELAIECGSNCVRVGTALFGARTAPSTPSN